MGDWLKTFEGELAAITYRDGESRVSAIKADVIEVFDDFILIRTFKNELMIRRSEILKIERPLNTRQHRGTPP